MSDSRQGARQTAWQLSVNTDSIKLTKGITNSWQSMKTTSDASRITYNGKPLQPFTKYYWRVQVWDKNGKSVVSPVAAFETGLMKTNWHGAWISDNHDPDMKPAPYFRKTFGLTKKVVSARAYIAVAGLYELYINGEKIGDHRLDPMYTRFDRRTLYVTYDVTKQLQSGKNAVGVLLGNGWYNHQSTAVWYFHKAPWRNRPAFCLDLRITYDDGSVETVTSNTSWKTSHSPIIFNSIYTAEHYDARLEQPGWSTPNFIDTAWKGVFARQAPSMNIVSQAMQPIRAIEKIPAQSIKKLDDKTYLFDIGRNISGVSSITVKGEAGTVIRLKHAEKLGKNGYADQSNIDIHYRPTDDKDPFQTDIFILSGKGEETFMPRFNYKGFQYVEVSSDRPIELAKESLYGYFMHSDVEQVGTITSSSTMLDKIWQATNASYLSNFFGYPTDCPQREKNGWTGDAHIASETGLYNFDGITIYEKWMADHRDEQQPNGVLPSIIPSNGWGYEWGNGPDWTSTVAIIPWNLYLFYGDSKALADNYEAIKKYADHIDELYPTGLTTWGLGDWVPVKSVTPVEFTSTAYYFADVTILAKAARLFKRSDDQKHYEQLALKIKNAFNAKYLDKASGIYDKGFQTEQSVPLFWGLAPDTLKHKIASALADAVKHADNHLDVGILGTKAILSALSDNGYADVAYAIASQETFPSWGWWIKKGATTLYENWNIDADDALSLNHIMFGEIGAWYFKGLGGIKPDPELPGFKRVILTPNFVDKLGHFEAEHTGPYGKIVSSWKRTNGVIIYSVVIPANSAARIYFPAGKQAILNGKWLNTVKGLDIEAGSYVFELR
ncbi:alpha-L-rhamnosidase [Mucilaginibacter sp. L3T2-6]|uniref:alpha-L-rhamnosidase n=1 Tax=Mucilaginibacter sp. L3T2-6 TaxID=3062491 RepID=UPI002676D62E|nr:alpha-L-rhamnosidase [Mucilaginibacter sp. L3T2-6]MDO3644335.1 family 78 glycoside hydrolase catalytic domain [Mucilaginibacter sp. L3T2-6]MDV6216786.1 family 78 glycoside hydrolase catalytic domain [Mucilaginibacter sp. L3T2-6]